MNLSFGFVFFLSAKLLRKAHLTVQFTHCITAYDAPVRGLTVVPALRIVLCYRIASEYL